MLISMAAVAHYAVMSAAGQIATGAPRSMHSALSCVAFASDPSLRLSPYVLPPAFSLILMFMANDMIGLQLSFQIGLNGPVRISCGTGDDLDAFRRKDVDGPLSNSSGNNEMYSLFRQKHRSSRRNF